MGWVTHWLRALELDPETGSRGDVFSGASEALGSLLKCLLRTVLIVGKQVKLTTVTTVGFAYVVGIFHAYAYE